MQQAAKNPPANRRVWAFGCAEGLFGLFVELCDVLPVHEIVEPGFEVLGTRIAVVDVIAVFPHIDAEQRLGVAVNQRAFAIGRLRYFELAALEAEPGPARTELSRAGVDEVGAELVET